MDNTISLLAVVFKVISRIISLPIIKHQPELHDSALLQDIVCLQPLTPERIAAAAAY